MRLRIVLSCISLPGPPGSYFANSTLAGSAARCTHLLSLQLLFATTRSERWPGWPSAACPARGPTAWLERPALRNTDDAANSSRRLTSASLRPQPIVTRAMWPTLSGARERRPQILLKNRKIEPVYQVRRFQHVDSRSQGAALVDDE